MMSARDMAIERSGGHCEAMVLTGYGKWTRCGVNQYEVHHLLTRARGGGLLDEAREIYHLMVLCHAHHRMADGAEAYEGDLLIDGYVSRGPNGRPVYEGSDEYLSKRYPKVQKEIEA